MIPGRTDDGSAGRLAHDIVQIEDFRLENLFASVSQKLPRQGRGPTGGFADFDGVSGQRTPSGQIAEEQFTLSDDGRQDAVELVRDPARQLADGFHFL